MATLIPGGSLVGINSTLYVGDADTPDNALETFTTWTLFAAGNTPTVINGVGYSAIDIWMVNTTVGQNGTLVIMESSASPITAGSVVRITEEAILDTDLVFDQDRSCWGLATGTDIPAKQPVRVTLHGNTYISLFMSASEGGVWYARYSLHGD